MTDTPDESESDAPAADADADADASAGQGQLDLDDLPQPSYEGSRPIDALSVDGDNPNEMADDMFDLLVDRLESRGWVGGPIITNTEGVIADGEHRWRAATEAGLSEVPVREYEISEEQRRLWRLELNKIRGTHDKQRDALELDYLISQDETRVDVEELFSATDDSIDDLLESIRIETTPSTPGYEYEGDHNVYFEDCITGLRDRVEDDSVDLVFTSPPYNVGLGDTAFYDPDDDAYEDDMDPEEYQAFLTDLLDELARVLKPTGHVFFNIADDYANKNVTPNTWVCEAAENAGLTWRSFIVWNKDSPSRGVTAFPDNGRFLPVWEPVYHFSQSSSPLDGTTRENYNVWNIPPSNYEFEHDTGDHPAPFPVALVERAITSTTDPGALVLDPFMGSGTTAVAAIRNDREYVGFELDADDAYRPIIERRIRDAHRQVNATTNTTDTQTETNTEADDD